MSRNLADLSERDLVKEITGHHANFAPSRPFDQWAAVVGPEGALALAATLEIARRLEEATR